VVFLVLFFGGWGVGGGGFCLFVGVGFVGVFRGGSRTETGE